MQKKIKFYKLLLIGLFFIISTIFVSTFLGRSDLRTIVVVSKEGIDITKPLAEQEDFFEEIEISRKQFENFNGTIVTSIQNELLGKRGKGNVLLSTNKLKYNLEPGTPVPKSALTDANVKPGEFAQQIAKYHTIFNLSGAQNNLPAGVQSGDKIDIALKVRTSGSIVLGVIMRDVTIFSIEGNNINVKVTQQEGLDLALAKDVGQFVLQLPGQKVVEQCPVLEIEIKNYVNEILAINTEDPDVERSLKIKKSELEKLMRDEDLTKEELIQKEFEKFDCYNETDKPTITTQEDIINRVLSNPTNQLEFYNIGE